MAITATNSATVDLQRRVESLHDHLYGSSHVSTPSAIFRELSKVLYSATYAEETLQKRPAFDLEASERKSIERGKDADCQRVGGTVREWFNMMNKDWGLFGAGKEIKLSDYNIAYCAAKLNRVNFSSPDRDVLGDVIETIRAQWSKSSGGQFFTDQRVTSLAVKVLKFNPIKGDDLVDICAGTGGFLLAGLSRIQESVDESSKDDRVREIARQKIRGLEIDEELSNLANSTLAARLGISEADFVQAQDALKIDPLGVETGIGYNQHQCVATNPPFGSKIKIKKDSVLKNFELAKISNRDLKNKKSKLFKRSLDILFIEQNLNLLEPGSGRMAIVLPYQILSGPKTRYIRHWLLKNAEVEAVIDLPSDTFQPHTGTKTALFVARRRAHPLNDIQEARGSTIFMAKPEHIGHDRRGNPVYERAPDGSETDKILTDFPEIEERFEEHTVSPEDFHGDDKAFTVESDQIVEDPQLRMNALYHQPLSSDGLSVRDKRGSEKWEVRQVKDVVETIFCPGRFKRNYVDQGEHSVPFLGGTNITQFIIETDKYMDVDDPKMEDVEVQAGWILVTRSGSTGIVSSVPEAWDGYAISEHVIRIIPNTDELPSGYLQAFLRSELGQEQLGRGVFGSVIDEITPEYIGDLEIPIPTDDSLIKSISRKIQRSETARNKAIGLMRKGIDEMNELLRSRL
jgi:16S rRNA G966 N2-methylase RsmD